MSIQRIADQPGRPLTAGNLRSMHAADRASHASAPWDELRVWDPGDLGKGGGDELDRGRYRGTVARGGGRALEAVEGTHDQP